MKITYKCYDSRQCCFRHRGQCLILSAPPKQDLHCSFAKRLQNGKTYKRKQKIAEDDKRPFWMKWPYNGRYR